MSTPLTWLGHASFRLDSPGGKRIYVDPWLTGNPKCPEAELQPERVDLIAVTHGHGDHVGDTVELAERFQAPVVALVELRALVHRSGRRGEPGPRPQQGRHGPCRRDRDHAHRRQPLVEHERRDLAGEPAGLVIELEDGFTLYFAGDTNVFMSMQLIGRIYEPDVVVLPIGDHYTMGPREAAVALELLGARRCVPCHYGTFPILVGTPDELGSSHRSRDHRAPSPARRSSFEGTLAGRNRGPGPRDRGRGRAGAAGRRALARRGDRRRAARRPRGGRPVVARADTPRA